MVGIVGDSRYAGDLGARKHIVGIRVMGSRLWEGRVWQQGAGGLGNRAVRGCHLSEGEPPVSGLREGKRQKETGGERNF